MVDYDGGPDNVVYETQCGNSRFSVKSIFWKMSSDKKMAILAVLLSFCNKLAFTKGLWLFFSLYDGQS